jgi:hypothetical protein
MRKLVWLAAVVALGYFAYTRLAPSSSPEVELVRGLETEFKAATESYVASMRQAAEPGLAAITDPERAEKRVRDVRARLEELTGTLTDEKAAARAKELQEKVRNFCERNNID